jgi:NCS1 family nucleobase:cation symporter-1
MAFLIGQYTSTAILTSITDMSLGFFISALVFYILNRVFPVPNMDQIDLVDIYGTFTESEARRAGVTPLEEHTYVEKVSVEQHSNDKSMSV